MRPLAVALVVALAGVALGQDGLAQYRRGEQLLTDARFPKPKDRQVYAVEGHPDLAISVLPGSSRGALDQRKADLDKLAEAGVPTLRVLEVGTIDGQPAYLHRRMATGTAQPNWLVERGPLLSVTTKRAIDDAKAKLARSGVGVKEAEIWVDSNGRVFVDAPKGVVTPAESGPWSSFYQRQTAGTLDTIKSLADISIAHRKNVLLREMKEAKDPKLARFFEFGTVDFVDGDAQGERALKEALAHYLANGESTNVARELGARIAKGEQALFLEFAEGFRMPGPKDLAVEMGKRSFPELAFDLVRGGALRALADLGAVERGVLADLHALEFWRAKKTPVAVASTDHLASRAGTIDAETLLRESEARSGETLSSERRAALLARARGFSRPSDTTGVSGALDERVREGRDRARAPR